MTRSELVTQLAARFPTLTQDDVYAAVTVILDSIASELVGGGRCEIRGFGSFSLNQRPERRGRNPKTGESVLVPAKLSPHFKPGLDLKRGVDSHANR
jgi:integration host factor subunit beta